MVLYRRNFTPGGTYFFTVNLRNKQSSLLIEKIDLLKDAINTEKNELPFTIKAYVILPDHLHTIWQLPPDDTNYSLRWKKFKLFFQKVLKNQVMFYINQNIMNSIYGKEDFGNTL